MFEDDVLRMLSFAASRFGKWVAAASFVAFLPRTNVHSHLRRDDMGQIASRYRYDYSIKRAEVGLPNGTFTSYWLSAVHLGWG